MTSLALLFAACLVTTFAGWYACGWIPGRVPRGGLRATLIALLCSPGVVVGHGFAVIPSPVALVVQPSVFTLVPMLGVWIVATGVIFGISTLRDRRSTWPPQSKEIFLRGQPGKFVFFGVIAALLLGAFASGDRSHEAWLAVARYGLFFGGATTNFVLCRWAMRAVRADPFLTPLAFAGPSLLAAAPVVALVWYIGGLVGGISVARSSRVAGWIAIGALAALCGKALYTAHVAATALPHVKIGGGVGGNVTLAALYALAGIGVWVKLLRSPRS